MSFPFMFFFFFPSVRISLKNCWLGSWKHFPSKSLESVIVFKCLFLIFAFKMVLFFPLSLSVGGRRIKTNGAFLLSAHHYFWTFGDQRPSPRGGILTLNQQHVSTHQRGAVWRACTRMGLLTSAWLSSRHELAANKFQEEECLVTPGPLPIHLGSRDTNTKCILLTLSDLSLSRNPKLHVWCFLWNRYFQSDFFRQWLLMILFASGENWRLGRAVYFSGINRKKIECRFLVGLQFSSRPLDTLSLSSPGLMLGPQSWRRESQNCRTASSLPSLVLRSWFRTRGVSSWGSPRKWSGVFLRPPCSGPQRSNFPFLPLAPNGSIRSRAGAQGKSTRAGIFYKILKR